MSLRETLGNWFHKDVVQVLEDELAALHARVDMLEEKLGMMQPPVAPQAPVESTPPAQ